MKVIIITSAKYGLASLVLPELIKTKNITIDCVILAQSGSSNLKKIIFKKFKKILKIGFWGAVNGVRMRSWYAYNKQDHISDICQRLGVNFFETPYLNSVFTKERIKESNADLGISLGNGYITESVFSIFKYGMINVHTEILPDFQGAQSIIWPIYEKKTETGFTIHKIDRHIDTGNIIYLKRLPIVFKSTLEKTVRYNISVVRGMVPASLSFVCENFEALKHQVEPQLRGKSYTTPSIWQFIRMLRNHNRLLREVNKLQSI